MPEREENDRVEMLRELQDEVSPEFLERVRNSIERRRSVAQVAAFSWHLPAAALWELVRMATGAARIHGKKGEQDERKAG